MFFFAECQANCHENNELFAYGPVFLKKCTALCEKKQKEYSSVYNQVKQDLEKKVTFCLDNQEPDDIEKEKLKACIYDYQLHAFKTLRKVLKRLRPKVQLDNS